MKKSEEGVRRGGLKALITKMPNLYSRLEGEVKCFRCGQYLSVGEKTWSHMCPRERSSYTEHYCLICFRKIWV